MRNLILDDEEIELLVGAIEEVCAAIAAEFDLLEDPDQPAADTEAELDAEQEEALDSIQRLVELREKIVRQASLGGGRLGSD